MFIKEKCIKIKMPTKDEAFKKMPDIRPNWPGFSYAGKEIYLNTSNGTIYSIHGNTLTGVVGRKHIQYFKKYEVYSLPKELFVL